MSNLLVTPEEAAERLLALDRVLVLTHRRPDGDTIGSAAALVRGLRSLGKTAYACPNPDLTPRYEPFLVPCYPPEGFVPDAVAAVDIAAAEEAAEAALTDYLHTLVDAYGTVSSTLCSSRQRGETLTVTLTAECVEQIALTVPIYTEESDGDRP